MRKPKAASSRQAQPTATPELASSMRLLIVDARLLRQVLFVALLLGGVWAVREVLLPLLFVATMSALGEPVVRGLMKRRCSRPVAAGLTVFAALLLMLVGAALVVPALIRDFSALLTRVPSLLAQGAAWLEANTGIPIPVRLSEFSTEAASELLDAVKPYANASNVSGTVSTTMRTGVGVLKGAASAFAILAQMALVPVLTFFVLSELPSVLALLSSFVPAGATEILAFYRPRITQALGRLVKGQLIVATMMAGLYAVGFAISGVPLALAVAVLAGAAYLVPFASATVGFGVAAMLSLLELSSRAGGPILGAFIVAVVVQLIESYILTPRIVGEQAGLSPLAALLAVLLGGTAAGFVGVLFALPVGCVVALVLREESGRRAAAKEAGAVA